MHVALNSCGKKNTFIVTELEFRTENTEIKSENDWMWSTEAQHVKTKTDVQY